MKITKEAYPEVFTGRYGKRYKLIKVYKYYGLYISEYGYKTCFNIDTIKDEKRKGGQKNGEN